MPRVTILKTVDAYNGKIKNLLHVGSLSGHGISIQEFAEKVRHINSDAPGVLGQNYRVGWYKNRKVAR